MKKPAKSDTKKPATATVADYDRRIIIGACPKGASGKSTALAAVTEFLRQRPGSPTLAVFDPDTVHKTLFNIFGQDGSAPLGEPHRVEQVDWRGALGEVVIDRVVRVLFDEASPAMVSLVDGVANQMGDVLKWTRSVELFDMAEQLNFRVTFLVLVDEVGDTVLHARSLFDEVGTRADYVIVRNLKKLGTLPWDGSDERERALGELGAVEVRFPGMTLDVQKFLDGQVDGKPHSLFDASQQARDMFMRARARNLWTELSKDFTAAEKLLLPAQFWGGE